MTPQEYLQNKLKNCAQYKLTAEDRRFIAEHSLKDFLFTQLTRKKFRRYKLSDLGKEKLNKSLDYCLSQNKPIIFRTRFGGYKLWRLPTTPEVDWAEFFVIGHYLEYLAPIIAAYGPGVKLHFASDDVFVQRLDNIPKTDTDAYYDTFQKLLDQWRAYFPKNFEADMIRHSSLFASETEFEKEFNSQLELAKNSWKDGLDEQQLAAKLKTSAMNIKWDGLEDLIGLSEADKQKKLEQSVIYHDALVKMPTIRAWSDEPDKIGIFTTPLSSGVIPIGSTKNSIVRFWVGIGVLEKKDNAFADRILSIQQYEANKNVPFEEIKIKLIPLKNFASIRVYKQPFEFANK